MSRQAKLFFTEELKSHLLEGGAADDTEAQVKKNMSSSLKKSKNKKGGKDTGTVIPDEDQAGFVKKTFGLFSVMILFQLVYVLIIAMEAQKKGSKKGEMNNVAGGIRDFATSMATCGAGIAMSIVAVAYMVCAKSGKKDVNVVVGYICWLLFTVGMTLVAGTIAARMNAKKILAAEISTMVATLACTLFGGKLLKATGAKKSASKMGPTVVILGLVLCTVIITCMALGIGGLGNSLILSLLMLLVIGFFILDIQFIVDGKYGTFTKDDYVLGSMKMFADFVLIFGIVASLF